MRYEVSLHPPKGDKIRLKIDSPHKVGSPAFYSQIHAEASKLNIPKNYRIGATMPLITKNMLTDLAKAAAKRKYIHTDPKDPLKRLGEDEEKLHPHKKGSFGQLEEKLKELHEKDGEPKEAEVKKAVVEAIYDLAKTEDEAKELIKVAAEELFKSADDLWLRDIKSFCQEKASQYGVNYEFIPQTQGSVDAFTFKVGVCNVICKTMGRHIDLRLERPSDVDTKSYMLAKTVYLQLKRWYSEPLVKAGTAKPAGRIYGRQYARTWMEGLAGQWGRRLKRYMQRRQRPQMGARRGNVGERLLSREGRWLSGAEQHKKMVGKALTEKGVAFFKALGMAPKAPRAPKINVPGTTRAIGARVAHLNIFGKKPVLRMKKSDKIMWQTDRGKALPHYSAGSNWREVFDKDHEDFGAADHASAMDVYGQVYAQQIPQSKEREHYGELVMAHFEAARDKGIKERSQSKLDKSDLAKIGAAITPKAPKVKPPKIATPKVAMKSDDVKRLKGRLRKSGVQEGLLNQIKWQANQLHESSPLRRVMRENARLLSTDKSHTAIDEAKRRTQKILLNLSSDEHKMAQAHMGDLHFLHSLSDASIKPMEKDAPIGMSAGNEP